MQQSNATPNSCRGISNLIPNHRGCSGSCSHWVSPYLILWSPKIPACLPIIGNEFKGFGAWPRKKNLWPWGGSSTYQLYWVCFDRFAFGGKYLIARAYIQRLSRRGGGRGNRQRRGRSERGLMCPGDVLQQYSKECLGQRTWKGSSSLGSSWPGFSLSIVSRCWVRFCRYVKQAGSKWLKICMFGILLK